MIDQTTQLILNVGNVIHDDVCLALSRVNFKELEDAPHSDRVDAAAVKIIALVEQDVARRLLSDETTGKLAERLLWLQLDGVMPELSESEEDRADAAWGVVESLHGVTLAAIGIDVEPQP